MPLNGSGTYTPPSPEYPAIPNTLILASDFNTILEDLATALSLAIYKDGQASMAADLNMASHKITNVTTGVADGDAVNVLQAFTNPSFTASGAGISFTGTKVTYTLTTLDCTVSGTYTLGAGTLNASITTLGLTSQDITITNSNAFSLSSVTSALVTSALTTITGTATLDLNGATTTIDATNATFTASNSLSLVGTNAVNINGSAIVLTGTTITLSGTSQGAFNSLSTGTTQAPGTDNTTLATTAFVQQAALAATMPATVAAVLFYNLNYI